MAKLLKLRRGTTSEHSSFTGAEGEATIDTTKDTLVVHDGSTAGGRALLREDLSNLPAGTIDNADVNNSAQIAGSKLADDSIAEAKLDIHADPSGTDKFLAYTSNGMEWAVPVNTNTQLTTEQVQDIVGAMFSGNTETNITATYEDSDGTIDLVSTDTNTQLSTEQVQDIVGAMFSGNTETGITVTYEDGDGTIDLAVASQTPEGTAILSTGESGGTKFLREDGDGSCSWQTVSSVPTTITVADESTDTTCNIAFFTGATGDLAPKTGDNLTFNSSTGALVATIVEDSKGNVRSIPINTQANAYTIAASDAGKTILASNTLYVNNNTMQIGDAVTIINNTAGNITITKQITTMYWTADGTNATRTLATRGSCTILYTGNTECYISGSGLS